MRKQRVKTFSCRMKNLVSESDSEPIDNPLYQEKNPDCGLCVTLSGAVMRSLVILTPCWAAVCLWTNKRLFVNAETHTAEAEPPP